MCVTVASRGKSVSASCRGAVGAGQGPPSRVACVPGVRSSELGLCSREGWVPEGDRARRGEKVKVEEEEEEENAV